MMLALRSLRRADKGETHRKRFMDRPTTSGGDRIPDDQVRTQTNCRPPKYCLRALGQLSAMSVHFQLPLLSAKKIEKFSLNNNRMFRYSNLHEKLSSAFRRWFRQSSLEWRFQFAPQNHSKARTTAVQFITHARTAYILSVGDEVRSLTSPANRLPIGTRRAGRASRSVGVERRHPIQVKNVRRIALHYKK